MSNIPPTQPRRPDPIRDSQAASSAQSETVIRNFLKDYYSGDIIRANKVYDQAMSSIPAKDKVGKNLSFDVVKKAILQAAEKDGKPIKDSEKLNDLEKLKPLFPKEEEIEIYRFQFIDEARETIQKTGKKVAELKEKIETSLADIDLKDIQKKAEELKEQLTKKVEETKDKVAKKFHDPNKKV